MKQTERLYLIDRLLREQGLVSFAQMLEALEISPATLKRDLAFMRDRLNSPILFDRDLGGYRLDRDTIGPRHELPGLWFDDAELMALLSIHQMLDGLDVGGLLGPRLKPLVKRLQDLLGERFDSGDRLSERVRFIRMHDRMVVPNDFSVIGHALLSRNRLRIAHFSRSTTEKTEREISPQRLVHYRNAWYLDAWCHLRNALRVFALDAIESVELLETTATEVDDDQVSASVEAGYGIFAGNKIQWARLRFTPEAARWVRHESWHPRQRLESEPDGSIVIEVPYSVSTELEMDILRHGNQVKVLAPQELADRIRDRLRAAADLY
ncbi:MAG: WYL domain-containing protein, partial [Burkholderiaceae bacterium]